MKSLSLLFVGGHSELEELTREAAQIAFPAVSMVTVSSVDEACHQPLSASEVELLVLAHAHPADLAQAISAVDAAGLPRWPLVVFDSNRVSARVEAVSPEERNASLLARVFHDALKHHVLRRENVRLKGDLLTIGRRISHDLRTPLGGIQISGELVKEILAEESSARAALMQPILDSADELLRLIKRVSFLTKACGNPSPTQKILMADVVPLTLQRLESQLINSGVSVTQPETWPVVEGVASWLDTIWWNLVMNALQHAGPAPEIEIGWQAQEAAVRFWVKDRGPGVPGELRGKLFQPFHSLHETNARKGLGLSIVQRLVELQGGHCDYEPRPEGGACFSFTLPTTPMVARQPWEHNLLEPALSVSGNIKSQ